MCFNGRSALNNYRCNGRAARCFFRCSDSRRAPLAAELNVGHQKAVLRAKTSISIPLPEVTKMRLTPHWITTVPGLVIVLSPHSLPAGHFNGRPLAQAAKAADTTSYPQFGRVVLLENTHVRCNLIVAGTSRAHPQR